MKTSFIADETSVFKEILITFTLHYITLHLVAAWHANMSAFAL